MKQKFTVGQIEFNQDGETVCTVGGVELEIEISGAEIVTQMGEIKSLISFIRSEIPLWREELSKILKKDTSEEDVTHEASSMDNLKLDVGNCIDAIVDHETRIKELKLDQNNLIKSINRIDEDLVEIKKVVIPPA